MGSDNGSALVCRGARLSSFDGKLEDLTPEADRAWMRALDTIDREAAARQPSSEDDRIDLDTIRNAIAWERFSALLRDLAAFIEKLQATGSPRLGADYAEAARIYLRAPQPPEALYASAR